MNKERDFWMGADNGYQGALELLKGGVLSSFSSVRRRAIVQAILNNIERKPGIKRSEVGRNISVFPKDLWDELDNLINEGVVIQNESYQLWINYHPR